MSARELLLSIDTLHQRLHYDPLTGIFTWRILPRRSRFRVGDRAGSLTPRGYRTIKIDDWPFYEHRLAWFYMTGRWPTETIDHVNLNAADNRFCNLREATHAQQNFNQAKSRANRSGKKGVGWSRIAKRWQARVMVDRKPIHIGYFHSIDDAYAAYQRVAKNVHGEFARFE